MGTRVLHVIDHMVFGGGQISAEAISEQTRKNNKALEKKWIREQNPGDGL